jgi:hypothetical protein
MTSLTAPMRAAVGVGPQHDVRVQHGLPARPAASLGGATT